jgi:hypothetical protein
LVYAENEPIPFRKRAERPAAGTAGTSFLVEKGKGSRESLRAGPSAGQIPKV